MEKMMYLLCMTLVMAACSTDDDQEEQVNVMDGEALRSSLTSGEWHISKYLDDDLDKTGDYAGFVFTFNADGTLAVTDQNTSLSGAWSITDTESDDDALEHDVDLTLFFASPDLFEELTKDWDIREVTATAVALEDEEDDKVDLLTFEKM